MPSKGQNFHRQWCHSRFFHLFANFTIDGEGLKILTYAGFFSVPHILWHRTSVYNVHLWGQVTLKLNSEGLALELWLPLLTTTSSFNFNLKKRFRRNAASGSTFSIQLVFISSLVPARLLMAANLLQFFNCVPCIVSFLSNATFCRAKSECS